MDVCDVIYWQTFLPFKFMRDKYTHALMENQDDRVVIDAKVPWTTRTLPAYNHPRLYTSIQGILCIC